MPTKIEWTNQTWNPTTGCNKVSPGCKNCYAETMHKRLQGMGQPKYQRDFLAGAVAHNDTLHLPFTWRKPRKVFVNSMSDLFHEYISEGFIKTVFEIMASNPKHTFQVLTKRPERMAAIVSQMRWHSSLLLFKENHLITRNLLGVGEPMPPGWVPPNIWLGTSVEDERRMPRITYLRQTPAAVRFLSCEPLLSDLPNLHVHFTDMPIEDEMGRLQKNLQPIHWVICGGESGHGARPMHPQWARSLRDQCTAAGVPFFFKQWGEWANGSHHSFAYDKTIVMLNNGKMAELSHKGKTKDGCQYNKDEWHRLAPTVMSKQGKHKSGRLLDGREWNKFPNTEKEAA